MNLPAKIWAFCCSLKLAIVLASSATVLIMGGSLLIPGNPLVFGSMDALPLGRWLAEVGTRSPHLSWWVYASALLVLLLGVNTLCCFADWLRRLRLRWRKTGEYLIHFGFVLILGAYAWGSVAGFRSEGHRLAVGQTKAVPEMPGHYLRLESFEPVFDSSGRPHDMLSSVSILVGESVVARGTVRTNHPLTYRGLAVLPASFAQTVEGFRFFLAGQGLVTLVPGAAIPLPEGGLLEVLGFYPHAGRLPDGRVFSLGETLVNPALKIQLLRPGQPPLRGWHFLKPGGPPSPLATAGLGLRPVEPVLAYASILNINRDPGAGLALAGAVAMLAGVLLALVSFYAKRARGDRPEI